MYEHGRGVDRNIQEALKCYQVAAKKGHLKAKEKIVEAEHKGILIQEELPQHIEETSEEEEAEEEVDEEDSPKILEPI